MSGSLTFAVLVTQGSPGPLRVLRELARHGHTPHTAYLLVPDWRANLRRVRRKLFSAGFVGTAGRILQIVRRGAGAPAAAGDEPVVDPLAGVRIVRVRRFDDDALVADARAQSFDLFLAMTDEILKRRTFSLPKRGTLNAHPARNPEFRGLSALERMLRAGEAPEVTLHLVDEGIDTGAIIVRVPITEPIVSDGKIDDAVVSRFQARAFIEGIARAERGPWKFEDRFLYPSSMSRALPAREARQWLDDGRRMSPAETAGR